MLKPLDKALRNQLENTVKKAREVAENAAKSVIEQLGVSTTTAYSTLSDDEKKLRRVLRAHARQLGDSRDAKGEQEVGRLIEEIAYEHWHRMLFARFLAENNLLLYPDPIDSVPVSLEECEDLAFDEGAKNGWELAARYSSLMLPQIFREDSPAFLVKLPSEHQQSLESLLSALPKETFEASDSLGWVYQFWQAKKKDEVNASEVKIGARELPAVTQLFTEPYMVSFLLDNSLGAWWANKKLNENDFKSAKSEEELRTKASIEGVSLEYLRFVQDENGIWKIAAGEYEQWPENLSELKTLDPSCGSGHFLVAAMLMLIPMRMELENLTLQEAVDKVLEQNIHGLDIDQRVTEIAAFALALTAWKLSGYHILPELHIACSGLSISRSKKEWLELANGDEKLENALGSLYDMFKDAPVLGSLIDPTKLESSLISGNYENVNYLLETALKKEQDDAEHEAGITAQGLLKTAKLLANKYEWVITNVPFLGSKRQNSILRQYCETNYPISDAGLDTVFLERCLKLNTINGTTGLVINQTWLFQPTSSSLRKKLLENNTWNAVARLGTKSFETISGEVVNVACPIISNYKNEHNHIAYFDVQNLQNATQKSNELKLENFVYLPQKQLLKNSNYVVTDTKLNIENLLSNHSISASGLKTGDRDRFNRQMWEVILPNAEWEYYRVSAKDFVEFSGNSEIIFWQNAEGELAKLAEFVKNINHVAQNWRRGQTVWNQKAIAVSATGKIVSHLYNGEIFDSGVTVVCPKNENDLKALWCFCSSSDFEQEIRKIDNKISVTTTTLIKIPCDLEYWHKVAGEKYPNGLPKSYSSDPTQWIFHGDPVKSDAPLHVIVARLLGYKWPAELDSKMELSDESKELIEKVKILDPLVDDDGIVCIPAIRGEKAANERILEMLAAVYGDEWNNDILARLLSEVDMAGKSLDVWLKDKFFIQHCKLFGNRPFIWHIWDGLKDGFAVLVNYHKLDYKTLQTLIYTYLGDWIIRQKQDIEHGIDGAKEKLAAAENLKVKLEKILEGEAPYDIFVRWKPLDEQPIGWNPDINDGIRVNIRPFMNVEDVSKKGAGVLRDKPNIKWEKDRGKDVESAPWYHLFNGDRINDHHLSLKEKIDAQKGKE